MLFIDLARKRFAEGFIELLHVDAALRALQHIYDFYSHKSVVQRHDWGEGGKERKINRTL